MNPVSSLRSTGQIQTDLARMSQQLTDLQKQIGSGARAQDMKGFGGQAGALLSAQSVKAAAEAKSSVVDQLQARFDVQGSALQQVAAGARALALSIRTATSANDGRGISTDLQLQFNSIVSALNQAWNGQPLFAGERQSGPAVLVSSAQQLVTATQPSDIFNESVRDQTIDLGEGVPITVAKRASTIAGNLFDTIKSLQVLLNTAGGVIGQPIDQTTEAALLNIANQLDGEGSSFDTEAGRVGQVQARLQTQSTQLKAQSDLLTKEIGDERDADLAQVSMQLNLLMTQYQASAKTFSDLSKLTLLNYL